MEIIMYVNANKYRLLRISTKISSEKDEKVVKPPQKPTISSNFKLSVRIPDFNARPDK